MAKKFSLELRGASLELKGAGLIGRHTECDVRLPLPDVSRRHASYACNEQTGQVEIVDLESYNGTFVNGERVTTAKLNDGDELKIGGFRFTLVVSESDATEQISES